MINDKIKRIVKFILVITLLLSGPGWAQFCYNRTYQDGDGNNWEAELQIIKDNFSRAGTIAQFEQVHDEFRNYITELDNAGLLQSHDSYYRHALYGAGWCQFRIGELSVRSAPFELAYKNFDTVGNCNEEICGCAAYMAGDARLRYIEKMKFELMPSVRQTVIDAAGLSSILDDACAKFDDAIAFFPKTDNMNGFARIRKSDAYYQKGLIYTADEDYGNSEDAFTRAIYDDNQFSNVSVVNFAELLQYSRLLKVILRYPDYSNTQDYTNNININCLDNSGEKYFREATKAILDDQWRSANNRLNNAVSNNIDEAYYCRGYVAMLIPAGNIINMNAATREFRNFINAFSGSQEKRIELMIEDAKKRVQLETQTLTLDSARAFLDDPADCQQALDLGIYLLRRAKMESNCNRLRDFINNADLFLTLADRCNEFHDAVCFYRNLARIIRAICIGNNTTRAQEYQQIAAAVTNCRGGFAVEAKYVKAYCLFLAWDADNTVGAASITQAERLFRDLVNNHRSVRALYYLAQIFRLYREYIQSSIILYQKVIDVVDNCEGYSYFGKQSTSAIQLLQATNPPDLGNGSELNNVNYQFVQCPDNMITETICQLDVILDEIAVDVKKRIKIFGLPKASVYPTDIYLSNSRLRTFCDTLNAGIPTGFDIKDYYQVKLRAVVADDNVGQAEKDFTVYDTDGNVITDDDGDSNDEYFTIDEISVSNPLRVCIKKNGYYPYHVDTIGGRNTTVYYTALLAPVVEYSPPETSDNVESMLLHPQSNKKYKIIADPSVNLDSDCRLRRDFDTSFNSLRDFGLNIKTGEILALDGRLRRLAYYRSDGRSDKDYLELKRANNAASDLKNPEGITLDKNGDIYITDRDNNRVYIFNPEGVQTCSFGDFGVNDDSGCFVEGKLVGPAGISIEDDDQGVDFEGETILYRPHILVSDFYGIHKFDFFGHYLGSPVNLAGNDSISTNGFDKGDFQDLEVVGHGLNSVIYVLDRDDGKIYSVKAGK